MDTETKEMMSPEEEALGELFLGVLPALKLHLENQLGDCLCCGKSVSLSELEERIQLAEQYAAQAMESRRVRNRQSEASKTDATLLAWSWTRQQVDRMTDESKAIVLRDGLQGNRLSVRKDGVLYDVLAAKVILR